MGCLVFLNGHPGPLVFIIFSTTASRMAWWPSCTVFLKASIHADLPAQLNGPHITKLNISCLVTGKSLVLGMPTKEQNGFLWGQDHSFGYAVVWPGFLKQVSNQAPFPSMGWWRLITSFLSQHHSYLYTITSSVFGGRWAVSSVLRGHWPLWWQSASQPEPEGHSGGSASAGEHILTRNYLFYWVLYHITILTILWWWKEGGAHLHVGASFVCSLTSPHAMAKVYPVHC